MAVSPERELLAFEAALVERAGVLVRSLVARVRRRLAGTRREAGVILVEYALLLTIVAVAMIPPLTYLAHSIDGYLDRQSTRIEKQSELLDLQIQLLDERIAALEALLAAPPPAPPPGPATP